MATQSFFKPLIATLFLAATVYGEQWFPVAGEFAFAYDNFRSLPEGSWEGNTGAFVSLNLKAPLRKSFLAQIAGSYAVYDWEGRFSTPHKHPSAVQQQGFLTGAVSRETSCLNYGIAVDGMFNRNFGLFALNPTLSQVRGQIGYSINGNNEIGVWGAGSTNTSHKTSQQVPFSFRAISQVNLFWTHYFNNCAYAMVWGGTPCGKSLMYKSGRPGSFIVGARLQAPLNSCLFLNAHGVYMGARKSHDGIGSRNYGTNVCFALTYVFGKELTRGSPYMTLADNSTFLVDTNGNY